MNTAPASFFSGSNGLDASNKLPYFPDKFSGNLKVLACKGINPQKGGQAYIVEFEILSSNTENVPVGGRYSWYQGVGSDPRKRTTQLQGIIGFLHACLKLTPGKDQAQIEALKPQHDAWLNESVGAAQPLANAIVRLDTMSKELKDLKGQFFTLHNFSVVAAPAAVAA